MLGQLVSFEQHSNVIHNVATVLQTLTEWLVDSCAWIQDAFEELFYIGLNR